MDVFSNSLESVEVLDFVHAVAGLLDKIRVYDDAVALIAVTDGNEASVSVIEVICVCVEFSFDCCALKIESIVSPGAY